MQRTCLFCDRTKLTLEHVWPDWVSRYLYGSPRRGRFTAVRYDGPNRTPVGKPFQAAELNHKARLVCSKCNNGWMSDAEHCAKPVLQPLLSGHTVTLNAQDQATLRAWIVLRAMILERSGSAPGASPFYTDEERLAFGDIDLRVR